MKIIHLLSQRELTGAEAHAIRLTEQTLQAGHEVTVISDTLHLPTQAAYIARPIDGARGFGRLREILWLRKFIKDQRIDIVHAHSRAAVRIGFWATRAGPTALVSTIHGKQHYSLGKRLFDTYGERVIVVCENLKRQLVQTFKFRPSRLTVVRNPLFLPAVEHTQDRFRWMLVTRFTGPKGERTLDFLKNVLPDLLAAYPKLELSIYGLAPRPGSDAARTIVDLAARFENRVRHHGFSNQIKELFSHYALIIGGGRVGLAALGSRKACFIFGETQTIGFATKEKMPLIFASNCGDMSSESGERSFNSKLATDELRGYLEGGHATTAADTDTIAADVRRQCEENLVTQRVLEIYRSARLLKAHPKPIPVLMYHQVVEKKIDTPHRTFVTIKTFKKHLRVFKFLRLQTITFQELLDFKEGRRPLAQFPKRPLILTFDDGYRNTLSAALPLLKKANFKAVVYLLADKGIRSNEWDSGSAPRAELLNLDERQTLAGGGVFEIGSHGFSHKRLVPMDDREAMHELRGSKAALEEEFGRAIPSFAFTYGDMNERSGPLAREAGYAYAVNTDRGGIYIEENPWSVFRVNILPENGLFAMAKKASSWYRLSYYIKRGH